MKREARGVKGDQEMTNRTNTAAHALRFTSCVSRALLAAITFGAPAGGGLGAAEIDVSTLPPAAANKVDYERDILPIFDAVCFRCHGPEKPKSNFRLDNQRSVLKGGDNGVAIKPGDSANSPLIHYVAWLVEDMEMPPPGKGERLTPEQIALLRAWIDQGAQWPAHSLTPGHGTKFTITPTVRYLSVEGDQQKFREHHGQKEGFAAGYEHFELRHPVGKETELVFDGRALFDENDYRVALSLNKTDLGFVGAGYDAHRKHFDDTGGYYRPYNIPPPSLDRDLHVDIGKAWFDVGLTLPNLPRVAAGYEYQFRKGNQPTLQWGQMSNDPAAFFGKAIYPGFKQIDERTHIIKLDADYELAGFLLEDSFRAEFYDLKNSRVNQGDFNPEVIARHNESYNHFQAANTFRAEKQLRDWLFVSGGCLFARLNADGSFNQAFSSLSSSFPAFAGDSSDQIALEQKSHTVNLNTMLGPWQGLTFSAGAQGEWLRRDGLNNLLAQSFPSAVPAPMSSSVDRMTAEEDFALRYTKIPFTVLHAEARLQQEWTDHFERGLVNDGFDDSRDFVRDTDATGDLKQYRGGFTISSWQPMSFEAGYKRREKKTDYDHRTDTDGAQPPFFVPGNGYPAFIVARDIISDEVETKLVLRLASWLKATLKYQLAATDYNTTTAPATLRAFPTNVFYPGGEILAGNQDAHVYSANLTWTPWRRLYLSTTLSYSDSRIVSGVNNGASVAPYKGNVYSILSSGNYVLNARTDLHASYAFSRADYEQDNEVVGLPLGIRYDRHGLTAGLKRRLTKNLTGNLQYGYFRYREPTAAGANDYTVHAVLASMNLTIP